LTQLRQPTSLELEGTVSEGVFVKQLLHQPLLQLQQLHLKCQTQVPALDLAHLTQLQRLTCDSSDGREKCVLPVQLQQLQVMVSGSGRALASVVPLQQLQHLDLLVNFPQQQPLLQLTQLPALQHLTLRYRDLSVAAQAAAAWAQLPQLCGMRFEEGERVYGRMPPTPDEVEAVMQGVADCSGLTKLVLFISAAEQQFGDDPYDYYDPCGDDTSEGDSYSAGSEDLQFSYVGVAVCGSLAGLTGLQDLRITCGPGGLEYGDALALAALTGLTHLELEDVSDGVSTEAACAITTSLTQLRDMPLNLCGADVRDAAFLAALGQMTQLTRLIMPDNQTWTQRGLMQLTGLSRLQELEGPMSGPFSASEITDAVLAEFWGAVRQQ
jgi:hypothetical protein